MKFAIYLVTVFFALFIATGCSFKSPDDYVCNVLLCRYDDLADIKLEDNDNDHTKRVARLDDTVWYLADVSGERRPRFYRPAQFALKSSPGNAKIPNFDYYVTGTVFSCDDNTILVLTDILDSSGRFAATSSLYFWKHDPSWVFTVSKVISQMIEKLPQNPPKAENGAILGGQAFSTAVGLMDVDPHNNDIAEQIRKCSDYWTSSSEPWRKLAVHSWKIVDFPSALRSMKNAVTRNPKRVSGQVSCLSAVMAERDPLNADGPINTWASNNQFPGLARLVAVLGLSLSYEYPPQQQLRDQIEYGILAHCAAGAWNNASRTLYDYAVTLRFSDDSAWRKESDDVLAASALFNRRDPRIKEDLANRNIVSTSDKALLQKATAASSVSARLLAAYWLYQHKRQEEGARLLRSIQGQLGIYSTHKPYLSPLLKTTQNVLKAGRWESAQFVPPMRKNRADIWNVTDSPMDTYVIRESLKPVDAKSAFPANADDYDKINPTPWSAVVR